MISSFILKVFFKTHFPIFTSTENTLSNVLISANTNTRIWRIQTWGNERNFLNCLEQPVLFIALFLWTEGKVSWEQLFYDRILLVPHPASASVIIPAFGTYLKPIPKNHVLNMMKTAGSNIKATGRMQNVAWISSAYVCAEIGICIVRPGGILTSVCWVCVPPLKSKSLSVSTHNSWSLFMHNVS